MKKLLLLLVYFFAFSCAFTPATVPLEIDKPGPTAQVEKPLPFNMAPNCDSVLDIKKAVRTWAKLGLDKVTVGNLTMLVAIMGNPKIDWNSVNLEDEKEIMALPVPAGEVTAFFIAFFIPIPNQGLWLFGYVYNTENETITYMLNREKTKYVEKDRKEFKRNVDGINPGKGISI
jgi:hypothetical protein